MNAFFVAIPAGLVALFLVLKGRPVKPLLARTDVDDIAALNRQQLSLVLEADPLAESPHEPAQAPNWATPTTERERLALMQQLTQAMNAGPEDRLQAVLRADDWGASAVLPILRRGLRDSDARVMEAAASAMQRFRGAAKRPQPQAAPLPRNVARMR